MAYVDYFRCKHAHMEKKNKMVNYILWSEGYCKGNIIEFRGKDGVMEKGKLYEVVYSYSSTSTYCRVLKVKELDNIPGHVHDMECEYPYQEPVISFIQREPHSKDRLFDVYFIIKDKEQNKEVMFHTEWNGISKAKVKKEVKENFLTLDMGYPWNIIVCKSGDIAPELSKTIQHKLSSGTYNEWEAVEL